MRYRGWGQGNYFNINWLNVNLHLFFKQSFCWAALFECFCRNITFWMNVRIYSWGEKRLKWMSEYICSGKIHEYSCKWIYLSTNVWIYSNIQMFATHWHRAPWFRQPVGFGGHIVKLHSLTPLEPLGTSWTFRYLLVRKETLVPLCTSWTFRNVLDLLVPIGPFGTSWILRYLLDLLVPIGP